MRDDDDDTDTDQPRRKPAAKISSRVWLIIAAVVLVQLISGCVVAVVFWATERTAAPTTPVAPAKTYTRDEFRKLVLGKTPQQVIELLGKPESTGDDKEGKPSHYLYDKITYDTTTQKPDGRIGIWFERGVVDHISF